MDIFSKSDPFCIVYRKSGWQWKKIGKTEVIHDSLNPEFIVKVPVDFHFERKEEYKVEVYDSDDDTQIENLARHDFIGKYQFTLHEVVTARNQIVTRPLVNRDRAAGKSGRIVISAEELRVSTNAQVVIFDPVAAMPDDGLCFFIIYRSLAAGHWTPIFKSEIKRTEGSS